MDISLASVFPVANASGPETDQGTMLRFMAEMMWFPSAAASPYIKWVEAGDTAAIATMSFGDVTASGTFFFNNDSDIVRFEAQRFMERKGKYSLEQWSVPVSAYGSFNGIRIPVSGTAIWKLHAGDFEWFRWEIADIEYNVPEWYSPRW